MLKYILLGVALLLSACSEKEASKDSIVVGTSADNPPYEFIQDSKIVGLDLDIIHAIAASMGKEVVVKNLDFPGLFPALGGSNVDLVIAGISYTPERAEHFDFSDTYASSSMAVLYRKSDNLKSSDDFKGKVIGAQLGTTWDLEAKRLAVEHSASIRPLANNLVLVEELKSGSVDAVILEDMQVEKFISNNPELASFKLPAVSTFVIALPKGSEFKDKINKAIKELEKSGKLLEIKQRWLAI